MGNIDLVDKIIKSGNYDINACYSNNEHKLTPLHLAIMLSKTEMVKHLLKPPLNADPTTRNACGMNALQCAAAFTDQTETFDLLLAHDKVKVDDVDGEGRTALHVAALVSNVIAVQKMIDKGANPNAVGKWGDSPLHVAATKSDGIPIIDLLLEAQNVKGMGDVNDRDKEGRTALHLAASSSNEITAEHLIEKGADLHCRANDGDTPLHLAAMYAKDMQIIDVLLNNINEGDIQQYRRDENDQLKRNVKLNMNGLQWEIRGRLVEKGVMKLTPSSETDESSQEIDDILKEEEFDIDGRDENGDTPLILAIRADNMKTVVYLLERGADPTIRNKKGYTPFHLSADSDRDSYIPNLLLANDKVDINETTSYCGLTALHLAIIHSNLTLAYFLLGRRANPNVADENGATPLHWAARDAKDMNIVELLLEHEDLDVNCLDNEGRSALDYATMNTHGHGERIANLLKEKSVGERGSKLFKRNNKDYLKKHMRDYLNEKPSEIENCVADDTIPIEAKIDKILENKDYVVSAFKYSDVESVRRLLKNGADTKIWGEQGGNALHLASLNAETTDVIDVVLETEKFDIDGVDNKGRTPLYWAIATNNLETVRHLIQKGADPTVANKDGHTPLHAAVHHIKSIETVSLILENKQVDINRRDKNGTTALHCAIKAMEIEQSNNVEMVRYLLEKGADPTIRNNNGTTPFHLSTTFLTNTDVLGLMLENEIKIDIDEKKNDGFNALHIAIGISNLTTARFLLSKGANPNVTDRNGATPLHLAALLSKDMDMVKLLVNHPDVD
ncbi:ankyrin-2-like, partial [Daphnia pulicaria]|uniref:ankyrin-2-like n=1 Tax=Daphnia pulicaria TaxID=35523 RepID=UPI001EEA2138